MNININTLYFLSQIKNEKVKQFINLFLKRLGMMKRDLIQNITFDRVDNIAISSWSCIDFMIKKIGKQTNIQTFGIINLPSLKTQMYNYDIVYDLEFCHYGKSTLLCTMIFANQETRYCIIIDIINAAVLLITKDRIYKLYMGIIIKQPYTKNTKIYSKILNIYFHNIASDLNTYQDGESICQIFTILI